MFAGSYKGDNLNDFVYIEEGKSRKSLEDGVCGQRDWERERERGREKYIGHY